MMSALSVIIAAAACLIMFRKRALVGRWWKWLDELFHDHQTFTIPRCSDDNQENPLHRKAALYLSSLPALEDADSAALLSTAGRRPNDLFLRPVHNRPIQDVFLGACLSWTAHPDRLLLRLRRRDRRRVLRPYLNHLEAVADDIDLRRRDLRLFISKTTRWSAVPFTHPATLDTVAMDPDLKSRLRADLDSYLKGRAYYHRLGRVWRRSYLLHGPPGTGKSSFVAAMAKFLSYDVYDLGHTGDLRSLMSQTTPRSIVLVEDLDRYLAGGAGDRLAGMLNVMDGVFSCCGEERVMVFTVASGGGEGSSMNLGVDPAVLRPGRIDVQVRFPMCDFSAFKTLASSYLGLKDHKLYPQVEEGFQSGAALSPAEVGEIMIANQRSPSRALKSVISALQRSCSSSAAAARAAAGPRRIGDSGTLSEPVSGEVCGSGAGLGFGRDATIREFRKLYGLIRMRSRKEGTMPVEVAAAAAAAAGVGGGGGSHSGNEKDR